MITNFPEYAKRFYNHSAMETIFRGQKWLYELATPSTRGGLVATEELKADLGKATESALVAKFKKEALQSWAAAETFLAAYFSMLDQMPKDLAAL